MNGNTALTLDDIAAAFTGNIKRPSGGFFYTLGLFAVTGVMILLPIVYIGLVGLVTYGTYYHATHHFSWLTGRRVWLGTVIGYILPIFMGVIMAFFMVKPLLARRVNRYQPYALNPQNEPVLFDFIRRLCFLVGAPMPTSIALDAGANAGAAFRRGFASFFSSDLRLHIGLTLMAGLSARDFAGVIAHEFGHFTQDAAMRLHYIIERINGWFGRVVFERDSWDEELERVAEEAENGYALMFVTFARLGVFFSRAILWLHMIVARALSCYLSRRMEFHADQFQIRVAGSESMERTSARLNELDLLYAFALQEMRVSWNLNKRLPNNLPQFILNKEKQSIGGVVQKALKQNLGFVKTGLFHTHPSDADRVREARLAQSPGVVALERPATDLFENFPAVAGIVTHLAYEDMGLPLQMAKVFEVTPIASKAEETAAAAGNSETAAIDRFLFGVVTPLRPIFPKIRKLSEAERSDVFTGVKTLPDQIKQIADSVAEACASFDENDRQLLASAAEGADIATAHEAREQSRRSLHAILEACAERLSAALSLSGDPTAERLCNQLTLFELPLHLADNLRVANALYLRDFQNKVRLAQLEEQLANLEAALREISCPFAHGNGANLFEFFRATQPAPVALPDWTNAIINTTQAAYLKLLNEAVSLAERVLEHGPSQPQAAVRLRVVAQ
jgi:Zn-dependent protease with chaperone function